MTENMVIWFKAMFDEEISIVKSTIDTESEWRDATDGTTSELHSGNVEELKEYLSVLCKLRERECVARRTE